MKQGSPLRQLVAASIGAVITSVLQLLFLLREPGAEFDPLTFALAAITGAIIGWGYQLATGLQTVSTQALDRLESISVEATKRLEVATNRLEYTEEPLKMLDTAGPHAATIGRLLRDSLKEGYRYISYVNENQYFGYLISAIRESNRYEGIQRRPVRWFSNDDRDTRNYLRVLQDKSMEAKVRIFLIDEQDEAEMKEDLANEELMRFYWENTGQDVRTYWISTRTYREYYGEQNIPSDLALYDDKLLIQYDEGTRTLQFDVIQADDGRLDIFERLTEQVEHDWNKPFQRIEPSQEVLAEKV